jgi:phage tail-like protein
VSANLPQRYGSLPPAWSTGDYAYLEAIVKIGFPVEDAVTYLKRHMGNQVGYRLVQAARGEDPGTVRAIEVQPVDGGDTIHVVAERTLPDGTPASYYTPVDLVEIRARVESELGGPVPPLQPRDKLVLHVPVASYLRFLPGVFQGASPTTAREVQRATERSMRQWGERDEVSLTEFQGENGDQFRRFLFIFQHLMTTVTERIDGLPQITNPMVVDPKFLPWLSSWVNFGLDEALPLHQQRELVRRSIRLHRTRGTRAGIEEMIRVLTSAPVLIEEHHAPQPCVVGGMTLSGGKTIEGRYLRGEPPAHFLLRENRKSSTFFVLRLEGQSAFRKRFGERASAVLRRITHIVTREKPAHVSFTLQFDDSGAS